MQCGIEIHQQLEGKKLFCNCPTHIRDDEPKYLITRKMRASAGESGVVDVAAAQEQDKDKTFLYQGYDTTCLVEADEEPPHTINNDALMTALQFATAVNASVSLVVQVMRKTVVDGSNTSGFQRTALLARNGAITLQNGKTVRIDNINIEEDACRIIGETPTEKTYRLDRLGIPLIEIGTAPDISTPEECQEAAKKIGMILRSLPGVKRGLGTIRQDVNVSVHGGTRVEIKGAQDLRMLPQIVSLEVKRQEELLKVREALRHVRLNSLEIVDMTMLLQDADSKIIQKTTAEGGKILGCRLHGLAGVLGRELQPNYRVGTELSGRAKIKAGVGGIFHSDELPNYGINEKDIKIIRKKLKAEQGDAFVLVADEEGRARRALQAVHERAGELFTGVPAEVRKAQHDGTTHFLRPMPGAARMYPETDVPLVRPKGKVDVPELLEEKIQRYQEKLGLSADLAQFTAKNSAFLFEEVVGKYPTLKPAFIAETLTSTVVELKRKYGVEPELVTDEHFRELFRLLSEGIIHKDIILDVLIDMSKGSFDARKYATLSTEELHQAILKIIKEHKGAPFGALMGKCITALRGKASGEFISTELKKILEQAHS